MEKHSKEKIIEIGKKILIESDIIAKHGTSISNALSILDTGFNFHRNSMVVQKSKDIGSLCAYGWKENARGDAANVIISVSQAFLKIWQGLDSEQYDQWIKYVYNNDYNVSVIYSVSKMEVIKESGSYPGGIKSHVPKEFIKGCFIYCDNKNYLDFLLNYDEALEHLTYIENPGFFDNLTLQEQKAFINDFTKKDESKKIK